MKARRGTKANPFEVGEPVVVRKVGWKGIVRDRRLFEGRPDHAIYLIEYAGGPPEWLEIDWLEASQEEKS